MAEKVSYVKEALKEPLNIWGLVVCVAAAVYTSTVGHTDLSWIPLAGGTALESLYLATLPATTAYRRVVCRRVRPQAPAERRAMTGALRRGVASAKRETVQIAPR